MLRYVLTQTVVHLEQNQCPFCVGDGSVVFDWGIDLHTCLNCGARQSHKGWMYGNIARHLLQNVRIEWPPLDFRVK
jgi:hypothetical protein